MSNIAVHRRPFPVEATNLEVAILQEPVTEEFLSKGPQGYLIEWLGAYIKRVERHRNAIKLLDGEAALDEVRAVAVIDGAIAHAELMLKAKPEDIKDYSATILMITTAIIYSREMQNSGLWT